MNCKINLNNILKSKNFNMILLSTLFFLFILNKDSILAKKSFFKKREYMENRNTTLDEMKNINELLIY